MKITLRSLYKDLEKVNGKNLKRTSFGVKSTKKHSQKKSKSKTKSKSNIISNSIPVTNSIPISNEIPSSSKRNLLRKLGKAALLTGGTVGGAVALHQLGKVYGSKYEKVSSPRYDQSKANKLTQLNKDKNILTTAGYSFGESRFTNKTKLFLKNLGKGMWKHKKKIIGLSYIGFIALSSGREHGRIVKFSKALTPQERNEFEIFKKESKEIIDKYNKTKNDRELNTDLNNLLVKNVRILKLIGEYYKLYYPESYEMMQQIIKKQQAEQQEMD
jgi:hypothetical protein